MPIHHQCLSCKDERRMKKVIINLFKNGQPAIQGNCAECGSRMTRMLPKFPPLEQGILRDSDRS